MSTLGWIISFTLLGGFFSASLAGLFLLLDERARSRSMPYLVAFATGALPGAALPGRLPEASAPAAPDHFETVGLSLLGGIALFFILEKLVLWRHCHEDHCETHVPTHDHHDKASASLLLVGDAVHNLLDGVLIAAAFLTDVKLGIVAGFAVMAHEIPSEVGNFAVLLQGGMSRARALFFNLATSLTSVAGGLVGFFALSQARSALPYALGVSAASLLYVAVADLIPGLHRRIDARSSVKQVLLMTLGVGVIFVVEKLLPHG